MRDTLIPPRFLTPGTVVNAPMKSWLGLTWHYGIVSNRIVPEGLPIMLANSWATGGPGEESWDKFTEGQHHYSRAWYPSALLPEEVLANAYRLFGTRYNLVTWNCEHFVTSCHGLPAASKQIRVAMAAVMGGLALAAARG